MRRQNCEFECVLINQETIFRICKIAIYYYFNLCINAGIFYSSLHIVSADFFSADWFAAIVRDIFPVLFRMGRPFFPVQFCFVRKIESDSNRNAPLMTLRGRSIFQESFRRYRRNYCSPLRHSLPYPKSTLLASQSRYQSNLLLAVQATWFFLIYRRRFSKSRKNICRYFFNFFGN